ncbi:hypothetical protein [Stetteria hydrogenophila]
MPLPEGAADLMLETLRRVPEPSVIVTASEALAVVEEQEALGGCVGPLCRELRARVKSTPVEEAYAITTRGLVPVGRGGLEIDGWVAARAGRIPGFLGVFHTHPAGLAVPTPYDLAGARIRGSRVECVGARVWGRGRVMCIEAEDPGVWEELASLFTKLEGLVHSTDYYAPYPQGESLVFVPNPSPRVALQIELEALALAEALALSAYIIEEG